MSTAGPPAPAVPSPSVLDRLLANASLIYACLIVLGYIDMHAFYRQFGISISGYVGMSDVLFGFLPSVWLFFGFGICVLYMILPVWKGVDKMMRLGMHDEVAATGKKPLLRKVLVSACRFLAFAVVFGGWLHVGGELMNGRTFLGITYEWMVLTSPLVFLVVLYFMRSLIDDQSPPIKLAFIGVLIMYLAIYMTFTHGSSAGEEIARGLGHRQVEIFTSHDTIRTDTTLVYVGKVSNAVFVYDRTTLWATAVMMDDVTRIRHY